MVSESSVIFGAYIAYALATILVLRRRSSPRTALGLLFLGWLFLPIEIFPPETITAQNFTVDFIGTALLSNVLVTKAWIAPLCVLAGLAMANPRLFRTIRPRALDFGMAAFCLSPLLPLVGGKLDPAGALAQTVYLAATWGGTWLLGRVLLSDLGGRIALTEVIAWSGILLLPVALLEGLRPATLYAMVYGVHPFQLEGADRYFGFRPLGFFEHGNQYGIWIAVAALAATFRCLVPPRRPVDIAIAAVLICAAIAGQSVGAIILLGLGCAWLFMSAAVRRFAVVASALILAIGGTAYLSGRLPVERWAYHTPFGQSAVAALHGVGRLSLAYRVRRDQMALPVIFEEPLTGHGAWDWWRQPMKSRPWGLPLLVAGQYGLISFAVLVIVMGAGAVRQLFTGRMGILALIVGVAAVDAWLNSFIYIPAILAAAALAVPLRRPAAVVGAEDRPEGPSAGQAALPATETQ